VNCVTSMPSSHTWDLRLGFKVQGSVFRVKGLGFRVKDAWIRVWKLGFRITG